MKKKKKLTNHEWEELGNKARLINKYYLDMYEILNVFPNYEYLPKLESAYSSASKLICHLDNMYEWSYRHNPEYIKRLFIGEPE